MSRLEFAGFYEETKVLLSVEKFLSINLSFSQTMKVYSTEKIFCFKFLLTLSNLKLHIEKWLTLLLSFLFSKSFKSYMLMYHVFRNKRCTFDLFSFHMTTNGLILCLQSIVEYSKILVKNWIWSENKLNNFEYTIYYFYFIDWTKVESIFSIRKKESGTLLRKTGERVDLYREVRTFQ